MSQQAQKRFNGSRQKQTQLRSNDNIERRMDREKAAVQQSMLKGDSCSPTHTRSEDQLGAQRLGNSSQADTTFEPEQWPREPQEEAIRGISEQRQQRRYTQCQGTWVRHKWSVGPCHGNHNGDARKDRTIPQHVNNRKHVLRVYQTVASGLMEQKGCHSGTGETGT